MVEQKKALLSLQLKIVEAIRELEESGRPTSRPLDFETTDFKFRLDYEEKRRIFKLIKTDEEIIGVEEEA